MLLVGFLFLVCIFMGLTSPTVDAYVSLVPIEDPVTGGSVSTFSSASDYLVKVFGFGIAIAGVLAVLMIVIAGIEYIGGAANPSAKGDAKNRIRNALFGLIIAFAAFILLKAINPDLVIIGF